MNYSIVLNPAPVFTGSQQSQADHRSEQDKKVTNPSDPQQELNQGESKNCVREFIVRMTPMMQKRKCFDNSYYKDALLRAAGAKDVPEEEMPGSEILSNSVKKKILISPFSSSHNSTSNKGDTQNIAPKLDYSSEKKENPSQIFRYSSQKKIAPKNSRSEERSRSKSS